MTVYLEALDRRLLGEQLLRIRLGSPFLLRTVTPAPDELAGKRVVGLRRIGKRIVIGLEEKLFLVIHLMIAGRFKWLAPGAKIPGGKAGLAAFDFTSGTLALTEQGAKRRASLHLVRGEDELKQFDPGGMEIFDVTLDRFRDALRRERHTLKRSLTDPHLFSPARAARDAGSHRSTRCRFRGRPIPRESHRVPSGDGRPWQVQRALPRLRDEGPAHRLRGKRNELLRALPDWRKAARRSRSVAPAAWRLAEVDR